ncbi:unnamed protein product [Prorocentrum cordatum]|uniref:Sel1 repeat family protein n=1 Tax=Prorocentrum cordatum TaxID=2364126 RepID=A0ABN9WCR1_9DINO|nr:unnamed protein product [Polarella glacialis]
MLRAAAGGHEKAKRSRLINVPRAPWEDYDHETLGVEWGRRILNEAQGGNRNAQVKLGQMYYLGQGVDVDKARSCYWYMQAAQQGVAEAMYQASGMLINGDGVEKDERYGVRLLLGAAEGGLSCAQYNIAGFYFFGWHGVDVNRVAAMRWFHQAAEQGHVRSAGFLGWHLCLGSVGPANKEQGRRWLEFAASHDDVDAIKSLEILF